MPDVYSPVLGAALALLIGSLLCLLSGRLARSAHLLRLARIGALLTLAALVVAVGSHLALGHRPGTEQALPPVAFLAEHPMVVAVALAAAALFAAAVRIRLGEAASDRD